MEESVHIRPGFVLVIQIALGFLVHQGDQNRGKCVNRLHICQCIPAQLGRSVLSSDPFPYLDEGLHKPVVPDLVAEYFCFFVHCPAGGCLGFRRVLGESMVNCVCSFWYIYAACIDLPARHFLLQGNSD